MINRYIPLQSSVTRAMVFLGGLAAWVIALSIPLIYLGLSLYALQKAHITETTYLARSVEEIIQTRPDMWEFESVRLLELISKPSINGQTVEREIRAVAGQQVVRTDSVAARPVLAVSAAFFDSGRAAGSIVTRYSIREQVVVTVLLGLFSSLLGYLIHILFVTYPVGKLDTVLADLQRGKDRSEKTLYAIGDGVISVNSSGKVELINPKAEYLLGLNAQEAVGRPLEEVYNIHQRREIQPWGERMSTILAGKGGEEFIIAENRTLLPEMESDKSGTVIIFRDITEQQLAEDELMKNRDELERAYNELKLTQSRLLQQEKMASIGQLAAGVAHEINNPMGFIFSNLGSLEKYVTKLCTYIADQSAVLEKNVDVAVLNEFKEKHRTVKMDFITADIRDLVNESLEGAERVKSIVQNLKSFSHVDQENYKEADINKCIESTINIAWNELKYKATIIKEYGDIPPTKCYPQQLNQVFMNLLINAVHAIEKQGMITIKTWHEDGSIFISVSDTGCGMTQETISHIFEPFFSTKEVGKGTGLGLSIAYDIISKHEGEITVRSEVGKGTTFTVRIPVVEKQA